MKRTTHDNLVIPSKYFKLFIKMTNVDLNSANEEIKRLKLLLNLKIDGTLNNNGESNEDKIRSEMILRMKIMSDIDEMNGVKSDMDKAFEIYSEKCKSYSFLLYQEEIDNKYIEEKEEKFKELRKKDEEYSQNIQEAQNIIKENHNKKNEIRIKIREIDHLISKRKFDMNGCNRGHSLQILNIEIDKAENIYKELKKKYKKLEIKNNPQKRKEMEESMSSEFNLKVNISEKKIRRSDSI